MTIFIVLAIIVSLILVIVALNLRGKKPKTSPLLDRLGSDFDIDKAQLGYKLEKSEIVGMQITKKDGSQQTFMVKDQQIVNQVVGNIVQAVKENIERRKLPKTTNVIPKKDTPEDYFRSLVFIDGKWQKP